MSHFFFNNSWVAWVSLVKVKPDDNVIHFDQKPIQRTYQILSYITYIKVHMDTVTNLFIMISDLEIMQNLKYFFIFLQYFRCLFTH